MDGDDRPFGKDIELGVGDEGGDFEDVVVLAVEAGHFEVYPDKVVGVLHGCPSLMWDEGELGVEVRGVVNRRA